MSCRSSSTKFSSLNPVHTIIFVLIKTLNIYNNSSRGVNLTPYSGVIFGGSYFNSKKEFKELFFRSKNHPEFGVKLGVKVTP